jgi:hypothetical protein
MKAKDFIYHPDYPNTDDVNIPQYSRHGVKLQKVVNCHDDKRETKV